VGCSGECTYRAHEAGAAIANEEIEMIGGNAQAARAMLARGGVLAGEVAASAHYEAAAPIARRLDRCRPAVIRPADLGDIAARLRHPAGPEGCGLAMLFADDLVVGAMEARALRAMARQVKRAQALHAFCEMITDDDGEPNISVAQAVDRAARRLADAIDDAMDYLDVDDDVRLTPAGIAAIDAETARRLLANMQPAPAAAQARYEAGCDEAGCEDPICDAAGFCARRGVR